MAGEDDVGQTTGEDDACLVYNFVVCVIIIGGICLFGLVGNLTSLCVLVKHKTETVTIFLLQSICVSDSLLLLASAVVYCAPAAHAYVRERAGGGPSSDAATSYMITVWPFAMMAHTLTIWLTLLVTFTRYGAVCRPQHVYQAQNMRSARLQVLAVLVLSVLYNIPRFFEHRRLREAPSSAANASAVNGSESEEGELAGAVHLGDDKLYQIIYSNVSYFAVMYIVPLSSLAYMNVRLIRALKVLRRKKMTMTGRGPQNDQITLCVIVIVCVFIVCQTPALVNQIFWAALAPEDRACGRFHFYYTKLSDVLVVFNSACNIIIYCLCGKGFRTMFLQAICQHCSPACRRMDTAPKPEEPGTLVTVPGQATPPDAGPTAAAGDNLPLQPRATPDSPPPSDDNRQALLPAHRGPQQPDDAAS